MIKAIIFDWHGVLDHVTSAGFIKIIKDKTSLSETKIQNAYSELDKERTVGKISQKEFIEGLISRLHVDPKIIEEAVEYVDTSDLNPEALEIVRKLKPKYKVALLTDASIAKSEYIKKLPESNLFDVKLFSSDEKMSKSNPEIFLKAARELGEKPEDILHIEDNPASLETSKKLGFQTYRFTTAEELENFLQNI